MKEEHKCVRCGLPKSEWKGRWEEPLCRVGIKTHDQHIIENTNEKEWIDDFRKIGNGSVRFVATREEVINFISNLLSHQRESIREEMDKEWRERVETAERIISLLIKYNDSIEDVGIKSFYSTALSFINSLLNKGQKENK